MLDNSKIGFSEKIDSNHAEFNDSYASFPLISRSFLSNASTYMRIRYFLFWPENAERQYKFIANICEGFDSGKLDTQEVFKRLSIRGRHNHNIGNHLAYNTMCVVFKADPVAVYIGLLQDMLRRANDSNRDQVLARIFDLLKTKSTDPEWSTVRTVERDFSYYLFTPKMVNHRFEAIIEFFRLLEMLCYYGKEQYARKIFAYLKSIADPSIHRRNTFLDKVLENLSVLGSALDSISLANALVQLFEVLISHGVTTNNDVLKLIPNSLI